MPRVAGFVRTRVSKSRVSSDNVGFFCSFRETGTRVHRDWGFLTSRATERERVRVRVSEKTQRETNDEINER